MKQHDPRRDLQDCILFVCMFLCVLAALYAAVH